MTPSIAAARADTPDGHLPSAGADPRHDHAAHTHAQLAALADAGRAERAAIVDEVVTAHLWLADSIARRFGHRGEDPEDLRQIARVGLVEACARFDPEQGAFVGFASATIFGLVKRHFRDRGWSIRPPRPVQELSTRMWQRWPDVAQAVGGLPTDAQLADALDASVEDVRSARCAGQAYTAGSLDAVRPDSDELGETTGERSEARLVLASVWSGLTETEQQVLRLRFYEERTQSDIATELGINQMQVSRLLVRVLAKLRDLVGSLNDLDGPGRLDGAAPTAA